MSVDYDANYGLGYYVDLPDDAIENEYEDGIINYVDGLDFPKNIQYFSTGGSYQDKEYCIVVWKEEINVNSDLPAIKKEIDKFIEENELNVDGEFGLVGGLYVR